MSSGRGIHHRFIVVPLRQLLIEEAVENVHALENFWQQLRERLVLQVLQVKVYALIVQHLSIFQAFQIRKRDSHSSFRRVWIHGI